MRVKASSNDFTVAVWKRLSDDLALIRTFPGCRRRHREENRLPVIQKLGTTIDFIPCRLHQDFWLATLIREAHNPFQIPKDDSIIIPTHPIRSRFNFAECCGGASRNGHLLQKAVLVRKESDPLPVGREKRFGPECRR